MLGNQAEVWPAGLLMQTGSESGLFGEDKCVTETSRESFVDHRLENIQQNYYLSQHGTTEGGSPSQGLPKETSGKKVERTTRPPLSASEKSERER
jgi:hypothetical protein